MCEDNINVAIRVRPLIQRELEANLPILWKVEGNSIRSDEPTDLRYNEAYTFDHIFGMNSTNKELHDDIIEPLVVACADGYNCTIFTYGQTSSGKTHTMDGSAEDPGVIPQVIDRLFQIINGRERFKFLIRVAYVEIYNERINDLLNSHNGEVKIREDLQGNITIVAKDAVTSTKDQVMDLMKVGKKNRKIHATKMNIKSSRSHALFRIIVECSEATLDGSKSPVQVSQFNLVDLAGSERVAQTKATGQRLIEGGHINKSLSTLAFVISQLADQSKFINYRDSKLTLILKNALGGNAKTLIIANITPASLEDSHSTLSFAKRAKTIKNQPKINTITSGPSMIRKCQEQILRLKSELKDISKQNQELVSAQERIMLINKAFVTPQSVSIPSRRRHTIGGGKFLSHTNDFHNIITKGWEGLSTPVIPLENSLLRVVRANSVVTSGDFSPAQGALPFEAQVMILSQEIGENVLETVPEEEEDQEDYCLADYTVNDMDLIDDEDENLTECTSSATICQSVRRDMAPFMITPDDISFETLEFQQLEEQINSTTNADELRRDLKKVTSIYNTLSITYTQQVSLNKVMEQQNRDLLDDIASLTRQLNMESNQRKDVEEQMADVQKKLIAQTTASPRNSISQKYKDLLVEVDQKDEEFFKLLREKGNFEKQCKEMSSEIEKLRNVRSPKKERMSRSPIQESNQDVETLTAQLRDLKFQLVDQEEIMNQLTNKHKRREEELLRRLDEKEGPREKLFSEIMKTERPVQATPQTGDDINEISTTDCIVQTEDVMNIKDEVKIKEKVVDVKEGVCQTDEKLIVSTFDMGCQAIDIDVESMELRNEGAITQMQHNIVKILTSEQSEEELATEQQVLICILQYAQESLETCNNKYICLQEVRENMSTTEESLKQACEKFANLIHLDMQNALLLAHRAPRSAKLLNHLLSEINQYKVIKEQGYRDIPAQLSEQITTLRGEIDRLQLQLYNEQIAGKAARNDYNKSKAEVALLKDTLHRVIPATTEKQILKDISNTVTDIDKVTHENVLLNNQLEDVKQKLSDVEDTNAQLVTQLRNMENELEDITNGREEQLKKREDIEVELIRVKADLINTALENDRLKIMYTPEPSDDKLMEGVSIHFDESDIQELPPPTLHDKQTLTQIWRENNQLKVHIAELRNTVQKQCELMAEYEKQTSHLRRASEEKDRQCEQECLQVRVATKITVQEVEAKLNLLSKELALQRTEKEELLEALITAKNDLSKMKNNTKDLEDSHITIRKLQADLQQVRADFEKTENILLETCEDLTTRTREVEAYKLHFKHTRDESFTRISNELVELSGRYQTEHEELETMKKRKHQAIFYKDYYRSKYDALKSVLSNSTTYDDKLQQSKSLTNLADKSTKAALVTASSVHDMGIMVEDIPLQEIVADLTQLQTILARPSSTEQSVKLLEEKNAELLNLKTENRLLYEKLNEAAKDVDKVEQLDELVRSTQEKSRTLVIELQTLRYENVDLEKRVQTLTEQLGYMSANLDSYVEQHQKLTQQKSDLLAGNARDTDMIKILQENIAGLEAKLAEACSKDVSRKIATYKTLEDKLQEQQITYELLVAEYQKVLTSNEKQLMKYYETEAKLEAAEKLLREREKNVEIKTAEVAKVLSDKQSLDMNLKQIEETLKNKHKLELALQDQLITVKALNAELTQSYESAKSHCRVHTEENVNLRVAIQDLHQLKKELEEKFEDMKTMNVTLSEQCEALKNMYTEEMKTIRENCIAHLEQNRCLTERMNQLEKVSSKEPPVKSHLGELQTIPHDKEAEIAKHKLEVGQLESKLSDTTKELRRIRSRCVCEGHSPSSISLESRRMKKNTIQDSQRHIPCASCSTLTDKVKKLESKILNIQAQQFAPQSESDSLLYYKCLSEAKAEKIEDLSSKYSKLEKRLDVLTKEKETLLQKTPASSSGNTHANLEKECELLRAQLAELTIKYQKVKAIARLRAKPTEKK